MFAAERIKKIKKILLEYKKVDVSHLSQIFSVSEVTIRKDLEKLENEGFLTKIHGGAVLNELSPLDIPQNLVEIPEFENKQMIGIIAAQMIANNEAVFIGAGSTCLQIAKHIKDRKNLTVVTNNISVAVELSVVPTIRVVLTGGDVRADAFTQSVVGQQVLDEIGGIYVDKAFIGVGGISQKRGFTVHDSNDAAIAAAIAKSSNELIIVADHTKFNKIAFSPLGDLLSADKVISDESVPEEYIQYFFEHDIPIYTTYRLD
ncbi:DeoR/GlpR family DNA-binding transcription regulator [Brevibacillus sp. B_LB10_24]|uniref:DeoR/GlpR family DNA-binding transcription regulator n=1 Tax=Brevibacillus sp. B_LB10_24 TaxID=3380645 RepID=UPI0038B7B89F